MLNSHVSRTLCGVGNALHCTTLHCTAPLCPAGQLLERACCYNCLQEWRSSIKDLDFILAYYPNYVQALLLRARCYTCIREWKRARDDYRLVLANDPANEAALQGLRDAEDTPSELPMLDKTFIDNES